ncbi:lipid-binding SYLF domain-containing protein [Thiomicrorhabdus xiamenensis]|uniref:Lipid-binding SYLF domain-containing protein n=2 Tax=Thiomicrorhabdus xiamenensis TaxID=2739063 RepID=A0A7D4NQ89_9GAMM|nr:lipid-binding SYLF domain-containing protein [Thiomicrorhabdus xiamenensis]
MAEDDVASADSDGQFIKRTTDKDYDETIRAFKNAPKSAAFFDHAYGYAIFPVVGKVGFVIGGAYGEGRVYKQGSFTGMTKLTQASLGFQFGGQAYSEIIFFQDQRAYDEFVSGSFEFGAQASAVVITAGVSGEASTKGTSATANAGDKYVAADGQYYKGMAVFNLVKAGLMYEAAISGQKFSFDPAH